MLALEVAHQRQSLVARHMPLAHFLRKDQGFCSQRLRADRQFVKQLLPRNLRQHVALNGFTTDDHVQRRLHPNRAWQPLCATRAGQQTQLDFRQSNEGAGCRHAVVTTQGQLQPAAHAHGVNGSHNGLAGLLHLRNHGVQIGLLQSRLFAKLFNVSAARERLARSRDHDGLHRCIGIGLVQAFNHGTAGGQTQAIDRRVVERDHGHCTVNLVFSRHGLSPSVL